MSNSLQRGMILVQQGRYDLAEREFRLALGESPDDALAHAFLSLCLEGLDRDAEALNQADEAIRIEPEMALSHYARGRALNALRRHAEAETSAREAIRLDPDDADHRALLAAAEMGRSRWAKALEAAEAGLALDPGHLNCVNLRAMALVQLGRKDEADRALGSALADDPENAVTHANLGWSLLHRGDHAKALEHFREALRLDPELEWARQGTIEALKARYFVYRIMLGFFLWMGRKSFLGQIAVVVGLAFGRRILVAVGNLSPGLKPFVGPLVLLLFVFVLMTWIASPLFNLTLRFNKFGRLALSREERAESNWIGSTLAVAAVAALAYLTTGDALAFVLMVIFGLLVLPIALGFRMADGWPRRLAGAFAAAVGMIGIAIPVLLLSGPPLSAKAPPLVSWYLLGVAASTWAPIVFVRHLKS